MSIVKKFLEKLVVFRLMLLAVGTCVVLFSHMQAAGQNVKKNQFSYQHKTEIAFDEQAGVQFPEATEKFAVKTNSFLNKSPYFDTSFIAQTKKVRQHHLKKKYDKGNIGKIVELTTRDGEYIGCTYFDRGSDKLLIIGEGFTNVREYMTPFVDMFPEHDVVLFDFRGHGYRPFSLGDADTWPIDLAKRTFGVDSEIVTFGVKEEFDVFAVVDHFKKRKNYIQVNGIGVCYGAFILLKAAALRSDLFDKLVVDGCWVSLDLLIDKLKQDLAMLRNPQQGGWKEKWPSSKKWFQKFVQWTAGNIWNLPIKNNVSILDYLPHMVDTDVLFFYGKDDLMITRPEWESIWNSIDSTNNNKKSAIITSNPHVRNHLKEKEVYKLVCDLYFSLDHNDFKQSLSDVTFLKNYWINKNSSLFDEIVNS
jgi:pimeloyl-ACP methyl ester carboxylesterase